MPELLGILAAHVADRLRAGELIHRVGFFSEAVEVEPVHPAEYAALAERIAADAELAMNAPTDHERRQAARRLSDIPEVCGAVQDTPTGRLFESIPGRVY